MYLELEFGPHGQHLGLLLRGSRNCLIHSFPIKYESEIGMMQIGTQIASKIGGLKIWEFFPIPEAPSNRKLSLNKWLSYCQGD